MNIIRAQRLWIVRQIDEWNPKRCKVCSKLSANRPEVHCQCEAAVAIRKLGEAYTKLSRTNRDQRIEELFEYTDSENLPVDVYLELKDEELVDDQIRARLGWSNNRLNKWKRENQVKRGQWKQMA